MEHVNGFVMDAMIKLDQQGHCTIANTKNALSVMQNIHSQLPDYIRKNTFITSDNKSVSIKYY